jgi:hypothetical protein
MIIMMMTAEETQARTRPVFVFASYDLIDALSAARTQAPVMSSSNTDLDEVPLSPVRRDGQRSNDQAPVSPAAAEAPRQEGEGRGAFAGNDSLSHSPGRQSAKAAPPRRGQRLRAGLSKVGTTLQKLNLAKLIDDMEQDQELADHLEVVNRDTLEERDRKDLVREAHDRCRAEMEQHLDEYLAAHPAATYEDWIQDLHPDNVSDGALFSDMKQVDMRFYVIDSDHRIMWNQAVGDDRQVAPRTYQPRQAGAGQSTDPVDLLDSGDITPT